MTSFSAQDLPPTAPFTTVSGIWLKCWLHKTCAFELASYEFYEAAWKREGQAESLINNEYFFWQTFIFLFIGLVLRPFKNLFFIIFSTFFLIFPYFVLFFFFGPSKRNHSWLDPPGCDPLLHLLSMGHDPQSSYAY